MKTTKVKKRITQKELESQVQKLEDENKTLRAELGDFKALLRRMARQGRKNEDLEYYYYGAIQEAAHTLQDCLEANHRSSSQIDENDNAVADLKRVVERAVDTIDQLRGSENQPRKKIKKENPGQEKSNERVPSEVQVEQPQDSINESEQEELSSLGEIFTCGPNQPPNPPNDSIFRVKTNFEALESEEGLIGGGPTFLAMKDRTSYMIATDNKGIKVVLNGDPIYCKKLLLHPLKIREFIYIKSLNCCLLCFDTGIWRKDFD